MLAAVLEGVGHMPLREVPKPEAGRGEVLVRVKACGICQTDYSAYTGARTNFEPGLHVEPETRRVLWKPAPEAEDGETVGTVWGPDTGPYVLVALRLPQPGTEARAALKALLG